MRTRSGLSHALIAGLIALALGGQAAAARDQGPPPFAGPPESTPVGPPATTPVGPPAEVPVGPPAGVPPGPPAGVPPGPPAGVPATPPPRRAAPAPAPSPIAGSEATVNLIHGIPGLFATVCVNGSVALPTFDFEDIATATLEEGSVDIAIVPAPTPAPTIGESCPATVPGLDLTGVRFDAGSNYSVVAHLGVGGGNVATVFENDVSSARPGTSRIVLHHVADADSLVARIGRPTPSALDVTTEEFSNGDEVPLAVQPRVRPGNWDVRLFDVETEALALGPERLQFRPRTAYLLYVVGAGSELSLLVLPVALPPF